MTKKKATKKPKGEGSKMGAAKKKRQEAFLEEYKQCATITHAAEIALISRGRHYKWLESDPAYAEAFEEAKTAATDSLIKEARRRAIQGIEEPVIYQGKLATDVLGKPLVIRKYSDTLLIFLLKGALPEVYRERHEVTGAGGVPLIPDPGRNALSDENLRKLIVFGDQLINSQGD